MTHHALSSFCLIMCQCQLLSGPRPVTVQHSQEAPLLYILPVSPLDLPDSLQHTQGYPQPMWPQGYLTGSPYPGSPLNEYGSLQHYQQQQVLQGMSRQQQVLFLPMLKALGLHFQGCHLTAKHQWHQLSMLTVPCVMQALQVRHVMSTMQCS